MLLGRVAFLRGDWDEALRLGQEATRHSVPNSYTSGWEWAFYLRILAYSGDRDGVLAVLDERRDDLPRPGQANGFGPWYVPLGAVEALYVLGERERAATFYPLLREFMAVTGAIFGVFDLCLVERIAGIGAAAGRHWDAAEEHFRAGLRQAEELPFVLEAAETRRFYARMLLDRNTAGDRDRARSLVEQALPVYRRIGMPRHEEEARRLLSP
jgi:tetratricopeptide (TPR) repeat protein